MLQIAPTPQVPDPRLVRALTHVITLGLVLVLLLPAARGYSPLIGWWPFWLVVAPACSLALLHRRALTKQRLAAACSALLVARARRRRQHRRGQARRLVGSHPLSWPRMRAA